MNEHKISVLCTPDQLKRIKEKNLDKFLFTLDANGENLCWPTERKHLFFIVIKTDKECQDNKQYTYEELAKLL